MTEEIASLHSYLEELDEEFGGDISFIPATKPEDITSLEVKVNWKLPDIFRHFLLEKFNGLIIGDKRILSVSDTSQKTHFHSTKDGEKLKGKDNIHYNDKSSKTNAK